MESKRGWSRRRVLRAAALGAVVTPAAAWLGTRASRERADVFLTANDDVAGGHFLSAVDARGALRFTIPVEERCHAAALHPTDPDRAVVVARRPGTSLHDLDLVRGERRRMVRSAPDRHFYGHACWSSDGEVLFTSENDRTRDAGVISVRDGRDLSVLGEMSTAGVGPHEIVLLDGGRTIAVANGGIATDLEPGGGRRNLNVPDMDPSLVYLDVRSGKVLEQVRPADHFSSLRHLSFGLDGVAAIAAQYEGPDENVRELVAFHPRGAALREAQTPREVLVRMERYVASVCVAPRHGVAAATCPRGGLVAFYDVASGELRRTMEMKDVAGVAVSADGERFVLSSGLGDLVEVELATLEKLGAPVRVAGLRWDNHMSLEPQRS